MAEQPQPARQTPEQVAKEKADLGPNATTTAPDDHSFIVAGQAVNAWGDKIGSAEDKKRRA